MDPKERDQQLEKWLDNALADYGEVEPQWGFEQRIVANVRAVEPRRRWAKFWIPVLAAMAVAVVIAALVRMPGTRSVPLPKENTIASGTRNAAVALPSAQPSAGPRSAAHDAPVPKVRVAAASVRKSVEELPRQGVFPTPTPMTGEERALMAFVRRAPREAAKVASAEQEQPQATQKLTIQAINIEPLEAVGFGGGNR